MIVGRFQMTHTGHTEMIRKAIELCDRVGILIGSSQESGTEKNPFPFELRREILKTLFPEDTVLVCPLPDIGVGNNAEWGEYVLENAVKHFGTVPDLLISGKEERRAEWFRGTTGADIAELYVPKSVDISASRMRQALLEDRRAEWDQYTEPLVWDRYAELRSYVINASGKTVSASI